MTKKLVLRVSFHMLVAGTVMLLGSVADAQLYEYNFDGGSILNTGSAADGDLTPFGPNANAGNTPGFVASRTDSNGVTRTDLYDFSVGGGTRSYFFSDIGNQTIANYTVNMWVRTDNVTPPSQFSSVFMNDTFQINNTAGEWNYRGSNTPFGDVEDDIWQMLTITNDGTDTRLYVDAVLGATLGDVGNPFNEIGIGINRARDNNGRFLGDIDDVMILDAALSDSQILALYNQGVSVPEPASIAIWSLLGLCLAGFGYRCVRRK